MSHVVARRFAKVNPDTALLAGLLHGIGQLYIMARAHKHPDLFSNAPVYHSIVRDWHSSIAKALLENWDMADEIVVAVSEFEDLERDYRGTPDLTDVLTVAHLVVSYQEYPDSIELNMQGVRACQRMALDRAAYDKMIHDCRDEIVAMKTALGC
jgi:HD-like signal output (HDOD) protein